jgi:ATPase subunit of ABC transporter with duplicated ATPase domains
MQSTSVVVVNHVSFETPNGRVLFRNLNFALDRKRSALVGPNGVGKTCLAKLLAGELSPSEGTIHRNGSLGFFPQRQLPETIAVDQYLAFDYSWSLLGEKLLEGIPRQELCSNLSGGQWMRVRLARAIKEDFLILDEPTNDLDRDGRQVLLQFLRDFEGGLLLISHDRECLRLCDEVLELSNRGFSKFGGNWDLYEEAKEQEREKLQYTLDSATRERDTALAERSEQKARQEKRNRRGAAAATRGGTPKILLGARKRKAQSTTGKIDSATLEQTQQAARDAWTAYSELKVDPLMYADLVGQEIPSQKLVAEAHDFNIRFQDWVYPRDLNFSWRGNIRLALKGANGSGKSTLLRALTGEELQTRGELRRGSLRSLCIDQRCAMLDDSKTVLENVRDFSMASETELRNGLAKFLFFKDSVFQKVETLSGGERLRAALACGFLGVEKPEFLILDEPTNNLDLVNVEFLENLLREYRGALLIISHDEVFLENCNVTDEFCLVN